MSRKIWQRVWNALAHGTVTAVDDTGPVLRLQLKVGYLEIHDGRAMPQQFGFSSVPPIGTDVVVHFFSGDRANGVVTATNHQGSRPTGRAPGETTVHNNFGMSIYFSQNGIVINGGGKPVHFINGDVHVDGDVIAGYGTTNTSLQHHVNTNVQTGGANSGPPPGG